MVNAQEWLDNNYPLKERKVISELNFRKLNLEGDLDLESFSYGLKIYLAGNPRLGKIKNKPLLTALIYQDPQEYLDHKYSNKEKVEEINLNFLDFDQAGELVINNYPNLKQIIGRNTSNITKLTISNCPKLGKVNIGGFINVHELILYNLPKLSYLDCPYNKLKKLDLNEFSDLEEIYCQNNYLTEIKLPKLGEKLRVLWLSDNDFDQDLSFLSHLVNLKELDLRNNRFRSSLEFLKDMNKLEKLNISNTDIDNGLEYLLDSVKDFSCLVDKRKDAKVKVIEEIYQYLNYNPRKIKEFINSSAQQWLDQNYPENGKCQRETDDKGWSGSHGWNNNQKTREEVVYLDISDQELKGWLRLKKFTSLKKLNCSNNQLVYLDLIDCPGITELKCDNNKFKKLDFLRPLDKLEKLSIKNNPNLSSKNLSFFISFKELRELDISNCPFEGSLKPLESLNKLEKISISRTNTSEGLEDLPKSFQKLHCELDYNSKTMEIIKELGKSTREGNTNWYNLDKWRIDQANNKTASAIPLEKLFVIRGNFRQFINKWGKNDKIQKLEIKLKKLLDKKTHQGSENLADEIEEVRKEINQEKTNLSQDQKGWERTELGKLQSPDQYGKYRYFGGVKWIARGTAVAGGILALTDQPVIGGSLAATSPFIDAIATYFEENYYKKGEEKWNEFLKDADMFLDNYHELLAITKSIRTSERGKINEIFRDLKEKVNGFLEDYDQEDENEEKNEEIDLGELIARRKNLAQELTKNKDQSKLWEIVDVTKKLENQVTAYRQGENIEEEVTHMLGGKDAELEQQIKEKIKKAKEQEAKQKNVLEIQLNNYQQAKNQLSEEKNNLSFLKERSQLTNEEEKLLKEKIEKLEKDLSENKKKLENTKKKQQKTSLSNISNQNENQPEIVVDSDEQFEINPSKISSSANLLDKSNQQQQEEIEMQAQILQSTDLPHGTPSSSK